VDVNVVRAHALGTAGALLLLGCQAQASDRVSIADPDLAATVTAAVRSAQACEASAFADFRLDHSARQPITFLLGEPAVCNTYGPTSYVRRSVKDIVFICRAFADEPEWLRPTIIVHETLHLYGVEDDHSDVQALNRRIARACR
jgi:hypothetical protein